MCTLVKGIILIHFPALTNYGSRSNMQACSAAPTARRLFPTR